MGAPSLGMVDARNRDRAMECPTLDQNAEGLSTAFRDDGQAVGTSNGASDRWSHRTLKRERS